MTEAKVLYAIELKLSSGFQRRLFFEGPAGPDGRRLAGELCAQAETVGGKSVSMQEAVAEIRALAADRGFSGVAH